MKRDDRRTFPPVPANGRRLLLAIGLCLLAAGCHSTEPVDTASAVTAAAVPPASSATANVSPEQDFVNQVKALPDDKRQDYLRQHPDLMQRVLDGDDRMLASQLSDLVSPPTTPPSPPAMPPMKHP